MTTEPRKYDDLKVGQRIHFTGYPGDAANPSGDGEIIAAHEAGPKSMANYDIRLDDGREKTKVIHLAFKPSANRCYIIAEEHNAAA
ncbi:hypothetical protein RZS28_05310 [Methylocapsa polymorpha]|uniref:Hypervirulence associated protein TUDOR domain-containing protein n=1 Tax=Methylocapsa polymorpha TaxID=3080828 RepID=A0ABZ0HV59_9HYPH|nr:hypothetical protein RZS28_05310 [Methylocapsa sp. RX1]